MDYQLKSQLRQILAFASAASTDIAGQTLYGSVATCWARVEPRYREVVVGSAIEERTDHFVVVDETFPLTDAQSRTASFWLPGYSTADSAQARRAKIAHYCYGEFGELDHVELVI